MPRCEYGSDRLRSESFDLTRILAALSACGGPFLRKAEHFVICCRWTSFFELRVSACYPGGCAVLPRIPHSATYEYSFYRIIITTLFDVCLGIFEFRYNEIGGYEWVWPPAAEAWTAVLAGSMTFGHHLTSRTLEQSAVWGCYSRNVVWSSLSLEEKD